MEFNNILKELRVSKNFSQQQMADILNLHQASYSRYENGVREPDYEMLNALANYFSVSVDYLLGRELQKTPVNATDDVFTFPVRIIGEGSCGLGCDNNDYVATETLDIPNAWISGSFNDYFVVVAKGDSMIDEHITNNSLILFKRQEQLESGQIGAFYLNGEEYIKKFKMYDNGLIMLQSANGNYEDIPVTKDDDFRIIGLLKKIVISKGD